MTQHDLPRSLPSPRPQRLADPCRRQLSDAIRHAQPDRTDDGLSDLSYALTLEQQPTHTLPYHLLAHRYLSMPLPHLDLHELHLSLTALHSATTQRLVDHPTLLMLSGQRDRFLHLFPGAHTPPPGGTPHVGRTLMYGLQHTQMIVTWAQQHQVPILFNSEDLRALFLRPGGTLTVTTTARYAPFSARLDAGLDPDRDASISLLARLPHTRDMHQLTFQLTDFNAIAHLAAHHHLHLSLQQDHQLPLVLPAPHDKLTVAAQLHTYQQSLPT